MGREYRKKGPRIWIMWLTLGKCYKTNTVHKEHSISHLLAITCTLLIMCSLQGGFSKETSLNSYCGASEEGEFFIEVVFEGYR